MDSRWVADARLGYYFVPGERGQWLGMGSAGIQKPLTTKGTKYHEGMCVGPPSKENL